MLADQVRKRQGGNVMLRILALMATFLAATSSADAEQAKQPRNVILFVPDGLRALSVTPESAPAMAGVRDKGVNFRNSHSVFPTFTTANASALATGHHLGDTGDFSNVIYVGRPVAAAGNSVTSSRSAAGASGNAAMRSPSQLSSRTSSSPAGVAGRRNVILWTSSPI